MQTKPTSNVYKGQTRKILVYTGKLKDGEGVGWQEPTESIQTNFSQIKPNQVELCSENQNIQYQAKPSQPLYTGEKTDS